MKIFALVENNRLIKNAMLCLLACLISLFCMNCNTVKTNEANKGDANKGTKVKVEGDKKTNGNDDKKTDPKLGDILELTTNGSVSIPDEKLSLKIESVADSRCPLNVNCIQAGTAKVKVRVIKDDYAYMVDLKAKGNCQKTDGSCGNELAMHDYVFTLISLTPYPGENGTKKIKQEDYIARVKVED